MRPAKPRCDDEIFESCVRRFNDAPCGIGIVLGENFQIAQSSLSTHGARMNLGTRLLHALAEPANHFFAIDAFARVQRFD